jgi:nonsense-mediated mRNA decay protein 3
MFCVECGKEGSIFKDGVCIDCYLKSHSFTKSPEILDITTCVHCESFKYKNTWSSEIFGEIIRKTIKNNFEISKELQKVDINTDCKEAKNGYECKVYISGFIDSHEITEEHNVLVRIKKTVCDVCSKRSGGYHEAIIQVRTDNRKFTDEELVSIQSFVERQVENLKTKGNRGLFITDFGQEHGGLDFFLSDRSAAQMITKKLQDEFGGNVKQSSKNIGMKDSKQIYRVTYLLRIPSLRKNDFIKVDDSFYQILSMQANRIKIIDLKTWEETNTDMKNLENAHIIGGLDLLREMIFVSQTEKEIQLMDQKTYKTYEIRKPKNISYKNKTIKTIKIENQIFLIPIK